MTSELRHAVEVWWDAYEIWGDPDIQNTEEADKIAAAIIEADREAVRAEQAAELAKWKALAETLAGALGEIQAGTYPRPLGKPLPHGTAEQKRNPSHEPPRH